MWKEGDSEEGWTADTREGWTVGWQALMRQLITVRGCTRHALLRLCKSSITALLRLLCSIKALSRL